jgi:hypothetical protein
MDYFISNIYLSILNEIPTPLTPSKKEFPA